MAFAVAVAVIAVIFAVLMVACWVTSPVIHHVRGAAFSAPAVVLVIPAAFNLAGGLASAIVNPFLPALIG